MLGKLRIAIAECSG